MAEDEGASRVPPPLVLIVDPDVAYRDRLAAELEAKGVRVESVSGSGEGLERAVALQPDLVMVGTKLEREGRGLELLPWLWEATAAPIMVMTGRASARKGLEEAARVGAVAYLSKREVPPGVAARFARAQLAALGRITSRFRRTGDAVLDVAGRTLRVRSSKVALTRKQALILAVLMDPPADEWKAIPSIARRVFGEEAKQSAVRKHINRLRQKFAEARLGAGIETAHARGYRLVVDGPASGSRAEGRGFREPL